MVMWERCCTLFGMEFVPLLAKRKRPAKQKDMVELTSYTGKKTAGGLTKKALPKTAEASVKDRFKEAISYEEASTMAIALALKLQALHVQKLRLMLCLRSYYR